MNEPTVKRLADRLGWRFELCAVDGPWYELTGAGENYVMQAYPTNFANVESMRPHLLLWALTPAGAWAVVTGMKWLLVPIYGRLHYQTQIILNPCWEVFGDGDGQLAVDTDPIRAVEKAVEAYFEEDNDGVA